MQKPGGHAVLKKPAAGDFRVQEELGGHGEPRDPSPAIVEQARSVLSHAAGPLLYARVDGIERHGEFVMMELEKNAVVREVKRLELQVARLAAR